MVSSTIRLRRWLGRVRGLPVEFDLRAYAHRLADINDRGLALHDRPDAALVVEWRQIAEQGRDAATARSLRRLVS